MVDLVARTLSYAVGTVRGRVIFQLSVKNRSERDQNSLSEKGKVEELNKYKVLSTHLWIQTLLPTTKTIPATSDDPQQYLLADSYGEEHVKEVRVRDKGSRPQSVRVVVAGVPVEGIVEGIVDTATDITIVGAEIFKRIAAVAKLRKRDLK